MKSLVLSILAALAFVACDGGGDASCATCGQTFSNAQCQSIATAHGCTSGEAQADTTCTEPTMGCVFHGCPAGPVTCTTNTTDSGTDVVNDVATDSTAADTGATE